MKEKSVLALRKFLAQFQDVLVILLPIATIISANVIASDKTGTLTKTEMTLLMVVTADGRVNLGGTGYAPEGEVLREGGGKINGALQLEFVRALSAVNCASTPCYMSAMYAARCMATRPKEQ
ncbi:MAG: hypothetical protein NHB15_09035 [Methanosarcina barkeri]|nr:hypothetical protein [Methanosarcina sp. ERenArc_MAG2]